MKKSILKNIIKEAISDMEVSLKLSNGKIIHGKARTKPQALSLQIGSNTYFSFWEGKFTLSGTGSVTIVEGVDDYSQEWFLKAKEEYLAAMHDTYSERFGPLQEGTTRDAFMEGWFQSKANIGGLEMGNLGAWIEYSRGKGSEEEKDAFLEGWFKARTTTDLRDVDAFKQYTLNEDNEERNPYSGFLSTDDTKTVIIRSNDDWEKLATSLGSKGFKHQGSLNTLNPNKGLTQMSNYAKFPYEVEINKTQKLVDFGEHTLNENKMTKRDIIRIINEEVETALDEMYDPIYDSMMPEILAMLAAGAAGVKMAINHLKSKGLDKQAIIDVIKKAKSKLNESFTKQDWDVKWKLPKDSLSNSDYEIDLKIVTDRRTKALQPLLKSKPELRAFAPRSLYTMSYDELMKLYNGLKEESINEGEEVYNVIDRETEKLITDTPIRKSLALRLAAKKKGWIIQKHKESVNEDLKATIQKLFKSAKKKLGMTKTTPPSDEEFKYAVEWVIDEYGKDHNIWSIGVDDIQDRIYLEVGEDKTNVSEEFWIDRPSHLSESVNENEGMKKSLEDIDRNLSLTKYDTTPPSFKITYVRKEDMSKEIEEELVAWVLSKGGRVDSVETMFDVEDGERYYYPYVKFSYK